MIRVDYSLSSADLEPTYRKVAATLRALVAGMGDLALGDVLEVRLCADEDGVCWFATGDVSYDTHHSAACEATGLAHTDTAEMCNQHARFLVDGVADQLAECAGGSE